MQHGVFVFWNNTDIWKSACLVGADSVLRLSVRMEVWVSEHSNWGDHKSTPSAIGVQTLGWNASLFPIETFKEKYIIGYVLLQTEVSISFYLDLYRNHRIFKVFLWKLIACYFNHLKSVADVIAHFRIRLQYFLLKHSQWETQCVTCSALEQYRWVAMVLPFLLMRLSGNISMHPVSNGCLCFTSIFVLLFQADGLQVRSLLCLCNTQIVTQIVR